MTDLPFLLRQEVEAIYDSSPAAPCLVNASILREAANEIEHLTKEVRQLTLRVGELAILKTPLPKRERLYPQDIEI